MSQIHFIKHIELMRKEQVTPFTFHTQGQNRKTFGALLQCGSVGFH